MSQGNMNLTLKVWKQKNKNEKELENKLNKHLNKECGSDEECLMKQQEEIVKKMNIVNLIF